MERDSPEISPARPLMSSPIPDDMVRPISASESAILSRVKKPAPLPELPRTPNSFAALPPLQESPPTPALPQSPRKPAQTLRQKVSRFFGGSDGKHLSPKGEHEPDHQDTYFEMNSDLYVPPPDYWQGEPMTPLHITDYPEFIHEESQAASQDEGDDSRAQRRRTNGPHTSNRHQTLQDALRQLETQNNGLTYDDIMRFLGAETEHEQHQTGREQDQAKSEREEEEEKEEEGVERPWQPDTWHERPRMQVPHNRPSDSNLSTNAPSTRPSIRPYVERAAAFMAGERLETGSMSSMSTTAKDEEEYVDDIHDFDDSSDIEEGRNGSLASTEVQSEDDMAVGHVALSFLTSSLNRTFLLPSSFLPPNDLIYHVTVSQYLSI